MTATAANTPQMGEIASRLADVVVTSDNPRTEDPQQILLDVPVSIPANRAYQQVQVDRAKAIAAAIGAAAADDLVLIAGKGHEDYQILGTTISERDSAAR